MGKLNQDRLYAILFILPSIIIIFIFVYLFIAWTGYISLTKWNNVIPNLKFVGLRNYIRLFQIERFQIDLQNTFVFTVLFILACITIGLGLAVLLDQKIKGESIFRSIFLFPMSLSFIVTGVVWRWILNPGSAELGSIGINQLFDKLGLGFLKSGWYTDPSIGIKAVVIAAVWQLSGYTMAMYLAGLRGISYELREAAQVDGATPTQVYRYVILPLLKPITIGAVIILGHISLKIFDLIMAMTGPGPGFSTDVPAYFMYDTTFRGNKFAQGASIAIIMLIMVGALVIPYLIYNAKRREA
ncbi:MAG TPA: sugar ABC transporter permease [Candidatus Atribacteria bacterium]|nr:sugar ABC transporter permease [Candidatus Atribacteria bacterium]